MMDIFAAKTKTYRRGCPICKQANMLHVVVSARKANTKPTQQVSKSVSFCMEHGQERYLLLVKQLVVER